MADIARSRTETTVSTTARACSPAVSARSGNAAALAAAATMAPRYMEVRNSPADEPRRSGSACR